jgi:hypothetical protein
MLLAAIAAVLLQSAPTADPCAYDKEVMLALAPDAFDQNLEGGWRTLSNTPDCREAAADLLAAYRTAHWGELTPGELHVNYWHEGQLRASLDQRLRAKRLLLAGVNPAITSDGFQDYALGTVAFLDNDREALQAARDRLAATPPPDDWAETVASFREQYGVEMKWPMNLNVLDNMLACFGRSYDEAYEGCKTP